MSDSKCRRRRWTKVICLMVIIAIVGSVIEEEKENQKSLSKDGSMQGQTKEEPESIANQTREDAEQIEKGYNLPIEESERRQAETDCKLVMTTIADIYWNAAKEERLYDTLSDSTLQKMVKAVKEAGYAVKAATRYSNLKNAKLVKQFLKNTLARQSGSAIIYEIHYDGGVERKKFTFDGDEMYVLTAKYEWNDTKTPALSYLSNARIKEWKYTKKGWFGYEVCTPEPPEVSEVVDGSSLIRIKPMTKKQREMSEQYVSPIGYRGNNLLCSDWDIEHIKNLDYNALYEYFYLVKYQKEWNGEEHPDGIPKEEMESLMMEFLPVTAEQVSKYAVWDKNTHNYVWERVACFNYAPTFFGTSVPEVTHIKENKDGTVTLTVDAVCELVLCEDALITHELTIQIAEDGGVRYLSNKIVKGWDDVPKYQYRVSR